MRLYQGCSRPSIDCTLHHDNADMDKITQARATPLSASAGSLVEIKKQGASESTLRFWRIPKPPAPAIQNTESQKHSKIQVVWIHLQVTPPEHRKLPGQPTHWALGFLRPTRVFFGTGTSSEATMETDESSIHACFSISHHFQAPNNLSGAVPWWLVGL